MNTPTIPRIKICGLSRVEDIEAVNTFRPDYCGFVVNVPRSARNVPDEQLAALTGRLDPGIVAVGVFVDEPITHIERLVRDSHIRVVQLHGHEAAAYVKHLRNRIPDVPVWQAFVVHDLDDVRRAYASDADMVLLDAGRGVGQSFDWHMLSACDRPFALAGGLDPGNARAAAATGAVMLDVSSGVETAGVKDPAKIKDFITQVRTMEE